MFLIKEAYDKSMPKEIKEFLESQHLAGDISHKFKIDISKAKFIEVPVPKSVGSFSIRNDNTKLKFYILEEVYPSGYVDKDVCIQGYTDDRYCSVLPSRFFARASWKEILSVTKAIYYIDLTDPDIYQDSSDRVITKHGAGGRELNAILNVDNAADDDDTWNIVRNARIRDKDRMKKDLGDYYTSRMIDDAELDPSGYLKVPLDQLKRHLRQKHPECSVITKKIDKYRAQLLKLQPQITALMQSSTVDLSSSSSSEDAVDFLELVSDAVQEFREATYSFGNVLREMRFPNPDSDVIEDYLEDIDMHLSNLKGILAEYETQTFDDWNNTNQIDDSDIF